MNQLTINGKEYQIKFDYYFYDRLMQKFNKGKKKDDDQIDGFNRLIEGLVAEDPEAVIMAYQEAVVGKDRPTKGQIEQALDEVGVWDSDNPYGDVFKEFQSAGFLKQKIKALLHMLKEDETISLSALSVTKETADKKTKDGKEQIKEAENRVALSKEQYNLTKKFLDQLAK